MRTAALIDGNEACVDVAYRLNEVCAIYPITPSSPMAELADEWSGQGRTNLWGRVPEVVEMQSEGGAAGAVHGSLQAGALTTTFTASQGLLLMIPNMYKIAGELTSCVFHVAARALATHALSIFGDHQDVMACRSTGFAMLASGSVQEAHDMALVAQAATLETRIPFLHFFDGFRTSHEINRIERLSDDDLRALIDESRILAHRGRALNPDNPFIRGTAQNPDVYFQAREAINGYYAAAPATVEAVLERFASRTGRRYRLFEYYGAPDAERVVILMGSGASVVRETIDELLRRGEKVGMVQVRLFRPFSARHLLDVLPASVRSIGVLDRTKEPGALGEPLYEDVVVAVASGRTRSTPPVAMPAIAGGRYGLGSKEFTPAMVKGVFDEIAGPAPRQGFTVGIHDDVGMTSIPYDPAFSTETGETYRAVFFGLGADGTVGANKHTIKIVGADESVYGQAYFVYDSKKSGSRTVSHLRFSRQPIRSSYLVQSAQFVGCHQFAFLDTIDVLGVAAPGGTVLLNSPYGPEAVWDRLPRSVQDTILDRQLDLHVIDASGVARDAGLGGRTNTILQTCFFALSQLMPLDRALSAIKHSVRETYGRQGEDVVAKNEAAVDRALAHLHRVPLPAHATGSRSLRQVVPAEAPAFVQEVIAPMLAGRGDALPVGALPVDGTFPSGTARWEKRSIAPYVPLWDPAICIQCGNCGIMCPHGVIRSKLYDQGELAVAPPAFPSAPIDARGFPETRYTLQVYADDCTGCGLCVEVCPAHSPEEQARKALTMVWKEGGLAAAREHVAFFDSLPVTPRGRVDFSTVRGTQFLEPLFEFSGACAGCGETPYIQLASRLFGDRMVVANATGCSSIYGGNLPTTPWAVNGEGRGPAWSNSLFEDNAEFGLGMRLALDRHLDAARGLLDELRAPLGDELVDEILSAPQRKEVEIRAQRERVVRLRTRLGALDSPEARRLLAVADHLVRRSVWIIGGDGWAYDIGFGGLDHVLATGRDVNLLVLDTEVYSNTGGQASKATPLGAVAKFASAGKRIGKKDLALQAISYGNVYVARVAIGANPQQALDAFREAETYPGPSLILAYSPCIAHGYDLQFGIEHQQRAVHSGYWPLLRYDPALGAVGRNPLILDSARPTIGLREFTDQELRFRLLTLTSPGDADRLMREGEADLRRRWKLYEDLAALG
jgi:pyruvate-ferredoxin/flavodoxin oxidoreductase